MLSPSVSTGAFPLAPFSIASGIPSPSESMSYGLVPPVPSVFGGVRPPFADVGTPSASTPPSTLPSLSESVPPASFTSEMPSLSESESKRFGIPSPSVSQFGLAGKQAAASTVSKIPSLSSSKSTVSIKPSPSKSGGHPLAAAVPATKGH